MTKYKFLLIIFLLLSCFISKGQDIRNDLRRLNLKGKVKSIVEIDSYRIRKSFFNTLGMKTEERFYTLGDALLGREVYEFDSLQKRITEYDYKLLDSIISKMVNNYDNKGRKINIFRYNERNEIISIDSMWYNGSRLIKKSILQMKEGSLFTTVIEYDTIKGTKISKSYLNGTFRSKAIENYNVNMNRNHMEYYDKEGKLLYKENVLFDTLKNIIEIEDINANGNVTNGSFILQFDSNKNWVKKEQYTDNVLDGITTRKIEYY